MRIALAGTGLALLIGIGAIVIGGSGDEDRETTAVAIEPSEPELLVTSMFGHGEIRVIGPCYKGTRGNDIFPPEGAPASDCYDMMSGGRDYLDVRDMDRRVYVRASEGTDTIYLGSGDDVIDVRGNFELVIDAGGGYNILHFPGLDIPDVSFRVDGEDIVLEGKRGSVRMLRQFPREGEAAPIQEIVFENRSLSESEIYLKSVDGQATDGDDILTGTPGDDVIYPGLGNDRISLLEGDDVVFYEGGNDTIMGSYEGLGFDTLSLPFRMDEVYLDQVDNRDMLIITPAGTITLQFQLFFEIGDERTNIERFVFRDGVYADEDLRWMLENGERARPVSQ